MTPTGKSTSESFIPEKRGLNVRLEGDQKLLRIFVGESDQWGDVPLHEAILNEARALGLAGTTVLRGFVGYGCHAHVHAASLLHLSQDLPLIIEIVDREEKINELLPRIDGMIKEGLVTLEKVHVLIYRGGTGARSRPGKTTKR
jgi:PII-like signaling protein